MTTPKMAAIRAVFAAMFDAVDVAGDFDESRWQDLIAAFNATGRLVFGWPHLESSESDIFGALDDIAFQLTDTKLEIEQTAAAAQTILRELRQEIGMEEPEHAAPEPDLEPSAEHEPGEERESDEANIPPSIPEPPEEAPKVDSPSSSTKAVEGPISVKPSGKQRDPVKHSGQVRSASFEAPPRGKYKKPYTSKEIAEYYQTHTRDETAHRFNTSPGTVVRRVREWEAESGESRRPGANPHAPLRVVELPPVDRAPDPPISAEAQGFDDRRQESAREASERTWRQRHPETA